MKTETAIRIELHAQMNTAQICMNVLASEQSTLHKDIAGWTLEKVRQHITVLEWILADD